MANIIDSAMDAIVTVDNRQKIVVFNAAAEKMFGCRASQALGRAIEQFIPERFRSEHAAHIRRFAATGGTMRAMGTLGAIWGVRSNGEEFPLEASISQVEVAGEKLFTVILRDITERQRADDLFRRAVESAPSGIMLIDEQSKIVLANSEAERLFGYRREELIGQSVDLLVPERFRGKHPGHRDSYHRDPSKRDMGQGRDLYGMRKDGTEFPVEVGLNPIPTRAGAQVMVAVVDITARKQAERKQEEYVVELKRSNEELEQFAYIASHDLQEPLRMVASYTELLADRYRGKLDGNADKYIDYAVDGARRMQRLIRDLLAYARVSSQAAPLLPTDASAVLASVLTLMRQSIDSSGAEMVCGPLPTVVVDEGQLRQVFQNLIQNALKFRTQKPPRVEIQAREADGLCQFSVTDNGIGMEMESAGRIFQMFQRLNPREQYEGTGIGLAISKRIVERHGGRIWFDSAPGQGTAFHFTIPMRSKEVRLEESSARAAGGR